MACHSYNDLMAPSVRAPTVYGSSTVKRPGVTTDCSSGEPGLSGPEYKMSPAGSGSTASPAHRSLAATSFTGTVTRSGTTCPLTLAPTAPGAGPRPRQQVAELCQQHQLREVIIE